MLNPCPWWNRCCVLGDKPQEVHEFRGPEKNVFVTSNLILLLPTHLQFDFVFACIYPLRRSVVSWDGTLPVLTLVTFPKGNWGWLWEMRGLCQSVQGWCSSSICAWDGSQMPTTRQFNGSWQICQVH
jgi:hypothetical protein